MDLSGRIRTLVKSIPAMIQTIDIDFFLVSFERAILYLYIFLSTLARTNLQKINVHSIMLYENIVSGLQIAPAPKVTHLGFRGSIFSGNSLNSISRCFPSLDCLDFYACQFFVLGVQYTLDKITISFSQTSIGLLTIIGSSRHDDSAVNKLAKHALVIIFSFTDEQPRYFISNPFVGESIMEVDGDMVSPIQKDALYQGLKFSSLEIVVNSLNHFKLRTYGAAEHDMFLSLDD